MFRSGCLAVLGVVFCGSIFAADLDVSADEALLRKEKVATDGPALVKFFERRVARSPTDLKRIDDLVGKLGSNKFRDRDAAAKELVTIGVPATAALERLAESKELELRRRAEQCLEIIGKLNAPEVVGAAVRVLRVRRPAGACAALLDALPSIRDGETEEEILMALFDVGIKDGKTDETLIKALADASASRRAAAAIVLGRSGTQEHRAQVRKVMETDEQMHVKLRAAQGLISGKDVKAVAALLPLLTEAPLNLAEQAHDLLIAVAADKAPTQSLVDLNESKEIRRKCRAEWERWWKDNKEKLDLSRAEVGLAWQGLNGRARRTARLFWDSLSVGNEKMFQKTTAIPFYLVGRSLTTREDLDLTFGPSVRSGGSKVKIKLGRTQDLKSYFRECDDPKFEKALKEEVFEKVAPREIRVVWYSYKWEKVGERTGVVFVRLQSGQAHIVGITEPVKWK